MPVFYRFHQLNGPCFCQSGCLARRYGRLYQFLRMDIGEQHEVTWWLSRN